MEELIPAEHPLRGIKGRVDAELRRLRPRLESAYADDGRPSIAPEQLIKATLLQALYSIRSERQLCEQIQYNMLYRWFLDLAPDAAAWNHSTFSKNRERFARHDLMGEFFRGSVVAAVREGAASREHFSVDGSLIEAWASMKSFVPREQAEKADDPSDKHDPPAGGGSNRWVDWRGEKRSNLTHCSLSDPQALLARKGAGREARLSHSLHALMENRHGLIADIEVEAADGRAEQRAALSMLRRVRKKRPGLDPQTVGGDAGFDDGQFLWEVQQLGVQPHVAVRDCPKLIKDAASLARFDVWIRKDKPGPSVSRTKRMLIEQIFGWLKTIAGLRKARFCGRWKIRWYAQVCAATWNFLRLTRLAMAN
jgi:transposase